MSNVKELPTVDVVEVRVKTGYLSQKDAAVYLRVSDSTMSLLIKKHRLPFHHLPAGGRKFKLEDLDRYADKYLVRAVV